MDLPDDVETHHVGGGAHTQLHLAQRSVTLEGLCVVVEEKEEEVEEEEAEEKEEGQQVERDPWDELDKLECASWDEFDKLDDEVQRVLCDELDEVGERVLWDAFDKVGERVPCDELDEVGERVPWDELDEVEDEVQRILWDEFDKVGERVPWDEFDKVEERVPRDELDKVGERVPCDELDEVGERVPCDELDEVGERVPWDELDEVEDEVQRILWDEFDKVGERVLWDEFDKVGECVPCDELDEVGERVPCDELDEVGERVPCDELDEVEDVGYKCSPMESIGDEALPCSDGGDPWERIFDVASAVTSTASTSTSSTLGGLPSEAIDDVTRGGSSWTESDLVIFKLIENAWRGGGGGDDDDSPGEVAAASPCGPGAPGEPFEDARRGTSFRGGDAHAEEEAGVGAGVGGACRLAAAALGAGTRAVGRPPPRRNLGGPRRDAGRASAAELASRGGAPPVHPGASSEPARPLVGGVRQIVRNPWGAFLPVGPAGCGLSRFDDAEAAAASSSWRSPDAGRQRRRLWEESCRAARGQPPPVPAGLPPAPPSHPGTHAGGRPADDSPRRGSGEVAAEAAEPPKERKQRARSVFTRPQLARLEEAFVDEPYPDLHRQLMLALATNISVWKVKNWFQNRRAKWRRLEQEAAWTTHVTEARNAVATDAITPATATSVTVATATTTTVTTATAAMNRQRQQQQQVKREIHTRSSNPHVGASTAKGWFQNRRAKWRRLEQEAAWTTHVTEARNAVATDAITPATATGVTVATATTTTVTTATAAMNRQRQQQQQETREIHTRSANPHVGASTAKVDPASSERGGELLVVTRRLAPPPGHPPPASRRLRSSQAPPLAPSVPTHPWWRWRRRR
ncbi:uncharacterized protein LOC142916609 [Petromyzon marinus]|uniref:uncharacterized protein LOC142915886 n=1 Tax=Petromyzon marinus TaxID=7757 RepID=UPI003F7055C5